MSMVGDVLLRDIVLVNTILCSLWSWVFRHWENKQTGSSYKRNDNRLLCLNGNGLCGHLEPQTHKHWPGKTLKTTFLLSIKATEYSLQEQEEAIASN